MTEFRGGPLNDGSISQVHSLIVHLRGEGMWTSGAYIQVYDEDVPLGVFEWLPSHEPDEGCNPT